MARTRKNVSARNSDAGIESVGHVDVDVSAIKFDGRNCGRGVDESSADIGGLIESVRQYGVLQPIVLTPVGDGYVVVAGARRVAAARAVGLTSVPAVIREFAGPVQALGARGAENLHRTSMQPWQMAALCSQVLLDAPSQRRVAEALGVSPSLVSRHLAVAAAITEVSGGDEWYHAGALPEAVASRPELRANIDAAYRWARGVIDGRSQAASADPPGAVDASPAPKLTPTEQAELIAAAARLFPVAAEILVSRSPSGAVRLSIEFASREAARVALAGEQL